MMYKPHETVLFSLRQKQNIRCFTISLKILAHFEFDGIIKNKKKLEKVTTTGWKNDWHKFKTTGGVFHN